MTTTFLKDVLLFVLANAIGFFAAGIAYNFSVLSGLVPDQEKLVNTGLLQDQFFRNTMLVWLGCLLLSFGFFFYKEKGRSLILLLPALLPILYGLSVLMRLSNAGAS
jgi:hypothetical protein